jgi:hypothetical protein
MTATSAAVRFDPDGPAQVESFLRLTGRTYIRCHIYPEHAPILGIDDAHVKVSVTVPHPERVTEDDVVTARLLAKAAAQYVTELEQLAATNRDTEPSQDDAPVRVA